MSISDKPANFLDFIIACSSSRAKKYSSPIPMDCKESVEIFDELDSLDADEFAMIYAMYLIGKGEESDWNRALPRAQNAGFAPLELMAFDEKLHLVLSLGKHE